MWWCCRLFNQLKLSASFFALLHKRTNNTLEFYCSESRVRAVVNMMLCYIFDQGGNLYPSFENLDQNNAAERAEDIWMQTTLTQEDYERWSEKKAEQKKLKAQNPAPRTEKKKQLNKLEEEIKEIKKKIIVTREGNKGEDVHYVNAATQPKQTIEQREFDWLRAICENIGNGNREACENRMTENIRYIGNYLCEDLNVHLHHRGFFSAQRELLAGRGEKSLKKSKKVSMENPDYQKLAAHSSPKRSGKEMSVPASQEKVPRDDTKTPFVNTTLTNLRRRYSARYRTLYKMGVQDAQPKSGKKSTKAAISPRRRKDKRKTRVEKRPAWRGGTRRRNKTKTPKKKQTKKENKTPKKKEEENKKTTIKLNL